MPAPIVIQKPDSILLLGKYRYDNVFISLLRKKNGDYFIELIFQNLTIEQQNELKYLCKFRQAISVSSSFLNEEYGINSVVALKHEKESDSVVKWKCRWYRSLTLKAI